MIINEGKEKEVIELLYSMLYDAGWSEEEIDKYIEARIE